MNSAPRANPHSPKALISRLRDEGHRVARRLGQNFLNDEALLNEIADAARADSDSLVLEIGPGPGSLTAALAQRAGAILAVEFDSRLKDFHRDIFKDHPQIEIIYADALRLDLASEAMQRAKSYGLGKVILAGNLPFQITSPLLFGQCHPDHPWSRMALMVQKEVADRIVASPGTKDYGILTVKRSYFWNVVRRIEVPSDRFTPRPKVDASALIFEPVSESARPDWEAWKRLSPFVDAAFNQRRKKLYNTLAVRWPTSPNKDSIRAALGAVGVSADVRAEVLTPQNFADLCRHLDEDAGFLKRGSKEK